MCVCVYPSCTPHSDDADSAHIRPLTLFAARSPLFFQTVYRRQGHVVATKPIVFMHGIGAGLFVYARFLATLPAEATVYVLEWSHVSMTLGAEHPPTVHQTIDMLHALLAADGHANAVFVGHSLGNETSHDKRKPSSHVLLLCPLSTTHTHNTHTHNTHTHTHTHVHTLVDKERPLCRGCCEATRLPGRWYIAPCSSIQLCSSSLIPVLYITSSTAFRAMRWS